MYIGLAPTIESSEKLTRSMKTKKDNSKNLNNSKVEKLMQPQTQTF